MIRRALAAALVGLALSAATAQAETLPEVEAAVAAGYAAWGVSGAANCTGGVIVSVVPGGSLGAADNSVGAAGRATLPTVPQAKLCTIQIADNLTPCELRGVAEHEVGHTLGYGHSPAPSIMAADGSGGTYYCEVADLAQTEAVMAARVARCRVAPVGWTQSGQCWANARMERRDLVKQRAALPVAPTFP